MPPQGFCRKVPPQAVLWRRSRWVLWVAYLFEHNASWAGPHCLEFTQLTSTCAETWAATSVVAKSKPNSKHGLVTARRKALSHSPSVAPSVHTHTHTESCSHEGLKRRHATKHQCSVLNRSLSAAPCEAWSYRSRGRSNGLLVASAAPGTGAIPPKPPAARAPLAEDGPPSFSTPRALLHTGGVFMKFTRVFETVANVILTAFMQSLCIRSWLRASRGKSRSCNTEPSKTASRGNA